MKKAILKTEYSEEFDTKRKNRMLVGWSEYGSVKVNYENGFIKAIPSCENCIDLYEKTGNKKYLIDIANFAMIEYMHPAHPNSNEDFGDTPKSATYKKLCFREIENANK